MSIPALTVDSLATEIWVDGETALFETRCQRSGEALIERGEFAFAKE